MAKLSPGAKKVLLEDESGKKEELPRCSYVTLEGFVDWDKNMWVKKIKIIRSPRGVNKGDDVNLRKFRIVENNMDKLRALGRHKLT